MAEIVTIGDATLYLGDCMDILPTLDKVDAVITDPPYGLGNKWQGGSSWKLKEGCGTMDWDSHAPIQIVCELPKYGKNTIIWGGNYFPLEPKRGWLLWDKIVREFTSGHAEMAWTTIDQPIKTFNFANGQLAVEGKYHPTQKPLSLMKWCIGFLPDAQTILDPFMGSGTTGVAALQMGRKFIGIEREPKYFEMACKRIEQASKQVDMFIEPLKQEQVSLAI